VTTRCGASRRDTRRARRVLRRRRSRLLPFVEPGEDAVAGGMSEFAGLEGADVGEGPEREVTGVFAGVEFGGRAPQRVQERRAVPLEAHWPLRRGPAELCSLASSKVVAKLILPAQRGSSCRWPRIVVRDAVFTGGPPVFRPRPLPVVLVGRGPVVSWWPL